MGCATWFEGFAFCAWDGGRLLTNAEWNYAAAGGDEQRVYPWSTPPSSTLLDTSHASYEGASLRTVGGYSPAGDGRWGQSDLAGSLWEMVLDDHGEPPVPCIDCGDYGVAARRVFRGGCAGCNAPDVRVAVRGVGETTVRRADRGMRCARNP
jgi:formylglycine-generating enzyme required for sulfatase activity